MVHALRSHQAQQVQLFRQEVSDSKTRLMWWIFIVIYKVLPFVFLRAVFYCKMSMQQISFNTVHFKSETRLNKMHSYSKYLHLEWYQEFGWLLLLFFLSGNDTHCMRFWCKSGFILVSDNSNNWLTHCWILCHSSSSSQGIKMWGNFSPRLSVTQPWLLFCK